jgi:uncharacterized Zn finger protein
MTNNGEEILKPCPFCGGEATLTKHFKDESWSLMHRCPKVGTIHLDFSSMKERHISAWNTRAKSGGG